eukprot:831666_1
MGSSFCNCSTPSKNNENMLLEEAKTIQHNLPTQNNDGKHCTDVVFTPIKQSKKAPNPFQTPLDAGLHRRDASDPIVGDNSIDFRVFGEQGREQCNHDCDDPIEGCIVVKRLVVALA